MLERALAEIDLAFGFTTDAERQEWLETCRRQKAYDLAEDRSNWETIFALQDFVRAVERGVK